jgi:hypothetical protein
MTESEAKAALAPLWPLAAVLFLLGLIEVWREDEAERRQKRHPYR